MRLNMSMHGSIKLLGKLMRSYDACTMFNVFLMWQKGEDGGNASGIIRRVTMQELRHECAVQAIYLPCSLYILYNSYLCISIIYVAYSPSVSLLLHAALHFLCMIAFSFCTCIMIIFALTVMTSKCRERKLVQSLGSNAWK